jgi:hypothetical protein
MTQIHSFYITNAKSELKFSSSNLSENELENTMQEITKAMVNNEDLFDIEEEDNISFDNNDESVDLNEENTNNLIITEIIDLDIPEFEDFRDSEEKSEETISDGDNDSIQIQLEDSTINFEAILAEEFDE